MVVVVPALPAGVERDERIVAAGVRRLGGVASGAPDVSQAVDRESRVPEQHCREEEADDEPTPTPYQEAPHSECPDANCVPFLNETQLREAFEVLHVLVDRGRVLVTEDPEHMRPPEPLRRGMGITLSVAVAMVVDVVGRPPQCSLLTTGSTGDRHHAGPESVHLVTAMGEVAVIASRDDEHPDDVEHHAHNDRTSCHTREDDGEWCQMVGQKRPGLLEVDPLIGGLGATATRRGRNLGSGHGGPLSACWI